MNWIRSAVLDVDQLILGSREAQARAWVDALQSFGIHVLTRRVRPMMGLEEGGILRRLTGIPESSPAGRRITQSRWLIYRTRYVPALRAHPDARALVERLESEGLRVAIASSGSDTDLQLLMDVADVGDLDVVRVATGNPAKQRASGSLLQAAATALREPSPWIATVIDTPHEVTSALRSHVTAIALRSGGWDERTLEGAAAVYDDLGDLLEQYDSTPLGASPDHALRLTS